MTKTRIFQTQLQQSILPQTAVSRPPSLYNLAPPQEVVTRHGAAKNHPSGIYPVIPHDTLHIHSQLQRQHHWLLKPNGPLHSSQPPCPFVSAVAVPRWVPSRDNRNTARAEGDVPFTLGEEGSPSCRRHAAMSFARECMQIAASSRSRDGG